MALQYFLHAVAFLYGIFGCPIQRRYVLLACTFGSGDTYFLRPTSCVFGGDTYLLRAVTNFALEFNGGYILFAGSHPFFEKSTPLVLENDY